MGVSFSAKLGSRDVFLLKYFFLCVCKQFMRRNIKSA